MYFIISFWKLKNYNKKMSQMLKNLLGDDEDYYHDSEDDENDDELFDDELSESSQFELESNELQERKEELEKNLIIKTLSDKKKNTLKRRNKFIPSSEKETERNIMMMTEEEMEHYLNLKYYGIKGPEMVKSKNVNNDQVVFKLDVLQSSKMFFEEINPNIVRLFTGSKEWETKFEYVQRIWWDIMNSKRYSGYSETIRKEVTEPKYITSDISHKKSPQFIQQLLQNRTDHMTCVSSDHKFLFIAGGMSGNIRHDDLIIYDVNKGNMTVYREMMRVSEYLTTGRSPLLTGQFMIEFNGEIYIFEANPQKVYKIQNISKEQEITLSCVAHPLAVARPKFHSPRNYFSINTALSEDGIDIFMFGGKAISNGSILDDLYIIHIPYGQQYQALTCTKLEKPRRGEGEWPSARFGHSSCMIANLIFVFGGKNARNQLLNDLYMFDTSTKLWTEINVESMLPPPVYRHQAFSVNNQSFYIYGGFLAKEMSNSVFRFDIVDKKWSLIEIVSDEKKCRVSSHQCLATHGKLWIIGGNYGTEDKRCFVKLMNLNDPGKRLPICDYLETRRKEGYLCDLVFKVRDSNRVSGEDSISFILAHKCIIKARCPYLHDKVKLSTSKMSCHQFEGTFLEDELIIVDMTECSTNIFEKYLDYLYTATIMLDNSVEVNGFLKFVKLISETKHYPYIQKICSLDMRNDLSLTSEILELLNKDLTSLIDDKTNSDLVIVLDQDEFKQPSHNANSALVSIDEDEVLSPLSSIESNIPSTGIYVHKLIVSRSPFFARMFVTSGMLESKEKVVHLTDYSSEVMMDLLKYLYTDIIQLTPRTCLGLLVYCLMLDLGELASCCRRMVSSLLDNNNVWAIHEICLLYNEKTLESSCEEYISNNYETLSNNSLFYELPEDSRIKIKIMFERKNKKK